MKIEKGATKKVLKLLDNGFGEIYLKHWSPHWRAYTFLLHERCELKQNVRNKCKLVTGGSRLGASPSSTSLSVVSNISMVLLLLMSTASKMKAVGGDMWNCCLISLGGEKMRTSYGPEFGDNEGVKTLMKKSLRGLKILGGNCQQMCCGFTSL